MTKWISLFLALFLGQNVFAAAKGVLNSDTINGVVAFSLGPAWVNHIPSQTLSIAPNIVNTYTRGEDNAALLSGELFLGLETHPFYRIISQTGLAIAAININDIEGDILSDGESEFNNYAYDYKLQHIHVAVKEKLLFTTRTKISPWISASVGLAWNDAYDFNNTPKIFEAVKAPNFKDHTQTAFTYTLGIGFQYTLTRNWQAGIGYEFADLGKSALGSAEGQLTQDRLQAKHLYTNGVLFNLTYVA